MAQTPKTSKAVSSEENIQRLQRQLEKMEHLLMVEASEEDIKAFDAETEGLLADVFGNPSNMLEAYTYAELGEAGGLINLPEEAQLEGDQDLALQSLHQRKAILTQALAELQASLT